MKTSIYALAPILILLPSCIGSHYGSRRKAESTAMLLRPAQEVVTLAMMQESSDKLYALASMGRSRGQVVDALGGSLLTMAANGVKSMIAAERKKMQAQYAFALNNLYFYNAASFVGPFDPVGMQFTGFRLCRTFQHKGRVDTAFAATFELDRSDVESIIRDGAFALRLTDLRLSYAKAKIPVNAKKTLNMDIEISFVASYITPDGMLHNGEKLGTFVCALRGVPLGAAKADYARFLSSDTHRAVTGRCFIVPRSYSYQFGDGGATRAVYSRGAYAITATVREATKDVFVNNVILENGPTVIDAASKMKIPWPKVK